jgi:hypothetical protein
VPSSFLRMRWCTYPRFSFFPILVSIDSVPCQLSSQRSFAALGMTPAGSGLADAR